jgi:mono/diheme cytochrome c family protein
MSRGERRGVRVLGGALGAAAALVLLAGCRQDMHDQPRIDPLAENRFFADGSGARPLPANTVARGELRADTAFYSGQAADGSLLTAPPMPVTRELLVRGQERFDIFCAPCHGRAGDGTGMVVQRGYKKPSSFHVDRLRQPPVAYFYFVMSNGFGVMPSYAAQIPAADRWAIAAYIRTLQLAHHYDAGELTADERRGLDGAAAHAPAAGTAH